MTVIVALIELIPMKREREKEREREREREREHILVYSSEASNVLHRITHDSIWLEQHDLNTLSSPHSQ